MKKRIAITGAKGVIGTVLTKNLKKDYDITPVNRPQINVRDYPKLLSVFKNQDTVIHLAWDSKREVENLKMFENVFKAAFSSGVGRVIMASSVHADRFDNWQSLEKMSPQKIPTPSTSYGKLKVKMEKMGKEYANKGLEVICIRFGGVNVKNMAVISPSFERAVWLSHNDCVSALKVVLEAKEVPNNFVVMYAISNNKGLVQNLSNPFDWRPKD